MLCVSDLHGLSLFSLLLFLPFGMEHTFVPAPSLYFVFTPKFTCWSPNSQLLLDVKTLGGKLSHGNGAIIRRNMKVYLSLYHRRTLQEDAALQTREKPSMLTPGLWLSSFFKNWNQLLIRHLVHSILLNNGTKMKSWSKLYTYD